MLLAHSAAVKLYNEKYQGTQRGKIGMALTTHWCLPHSSSKADTIAAKRSLDFMYGWFMNPLTYGDYPVSMRNSLGIRLPNFTKEQSESLKGSFDFVGVNYYATYYAISNPASNLLRQSYNTDSKANLTGERNGIQLPQPFKTSWIYIYPPGLQDLMLYTKTNYKNPVIYITENGVDELNNNSLSLKESLNDTIRLSYHRSHLLALRSAIRHGADVRGYFAWSFMDNFEWASGYTNRFGLYFVDYNNNLARYPKKSALWFNMFLKTLFLIKSSSLLE
jgi:beta-glucosidase